MIRCTQCWPNKTGEKARQLIGLNGGAFVNVDSTIIGKAQTHNVSAASTIQTGRILGMDRYKNRDQEIAPTDIEYRDFVASCGSGLLTAIWVNEIATAIVGIIEDRDQEIAPTGCSHALLRTSQSFRSSYSPVSNIGYNTSSL